MDSRPALTSGGARAHRVAGVLAVGSVIVALIAHAGEATRPFTVADSIAMTRLIDPDPAARQIRTPHFKFAPDGRTFVAITRRGNLASGQNEYALRAFDVDTVRRFVNDTSDHALPAATQLAAFHTSSHRHGIDELRWLSGRSSIAFIGRDVRPDGQIYLLDTAGRGTPRRLTEHDGDIATFDLNLQRNVAMYTAYQTPDWTRRNVHGYAVESNYIGDLTISNPADAAFRPVKHFLKRLHSAAPAAELNIGPATAPSVVSLSPSGRWAVALEPVRTVPGRWEDYALLGHDPDAGRLLGSDAFGRPSTWLWQFLLVDTATGMVRPLLDAPARTSGSLAEIRWSEDSASVIVAPTFLPLVSRADSHDERRTSQFVVEVNIASGRLTAIAELTLPVAGGERQVFLTGLKRLPDGSVLVQERVHEGDDLPLRRFRKRDGQWVSAPPPATTEELQLAIVEDMNTPPDIGATDPKTGRSRIVTALNPELRELRLGEVELFTWADRDGTQYTGGLLRPPSFRDGVRYPVVLQTYGFSPDEFLVDGPNGMATAFAARALAGKGLLVLQMPQFGTTPASRGRGNSVHTRTENERFTAMMEAAVDALDARGLIDRARVGLIGFSRTGMHVHYAITFSRAAIAAATIADSVAATPLSYAISYGGPPPGMLQWEDADLIGAPFWGGGIARWLERSPIFHLDKIHTPLRYEHLGIRVPAYWDTFAILRRHRRPVEMIHIPLASHRLETPFARYTSQQGNVDWFAFWLKGEEDNEPTKAATYARWRRLRDQHTRLKTSLRSPPRNARRSRRARMIDALAVYNGTTLTPGGICAPCRTADYETRGFTPAKQAPAVLNEDPNEIIAANRGSVSVGGKRSFGKAQEACAPSAPLTEIFWWHDSVAGAVVRGDVADQARPPA